MKRQKDASFFCPHTGAAACLAAANLCGMHGCRIYPHGCFGRYGILEEENAYGKRKGKNRAWGPKGVYDARKLGVPKMLVLGFQHTFAMFGAMVLVPILTGINVSTALLFAGLGTLLFHLLSQKGRCLRFSVPALRFWAAMLRLRRLALTERPARCCRMRQAAW